MEARLAQHLGCGDVPCGTPRLPALHRGDLRVSSVVEPMLLTIGAASSAVGPRQSRTAGLLLRPAFRFLPIPGRASSPVEDPQSTSASSWRGTVVSPGVVPISSNINGLVCQTGITALLMQTPK